MNPSKFQSTSSTITYENGRPGTFRVQRQGSENVVTFIDASISLVFEVEIADSFNHPNMTLFRKSVPISSHHFASAQTNTGPATLLPGTSRSFSAHSGANGRQVQKAWIDLVEQSQANHMSEDSPEVKSSPAWIEHTRTSFEIFSYLSNRDNRDPKKMFNPSVHFSNLTIDHFVRITVIPGAFAKPIFLDAPISVFCVTDFPRRSDFSRWIPAATIPMSKEEEAVAPAIRESLVPERLDRFNGGAEPDVVYSMTNYKISIVSLQPSDGTSSSLGFRERQR
ncbi:hypothetical protein BJ742DRAFT_766482 [Cladochytrium replicatum]|nr:hypothetical protein BJ742DRAFT_766482 [Cladochytrium replicatum]